MCKKSKAATFRSQKFKLWDKIFILIPGIPYFNVNPTAIFVIGLVLFVHQAGYPAETELHHPSFPQQKLYTISSTAFGLLQK